MRTETFKAAQFSFEFTFYDTRGKPLVAANVKCRNLRTKLPPGYDEKLKKIDANHAHGLAFQTCVERWWDAKRDRAHELGLGDIVALGRSGGWIALERFTKGYVQSLCSGVEWSCEHCQKAFSEHARGKCLFDATEFQPRNAEALRALERAESFLAECTQSACGEQADKVYAEELKYWIDTLIEEKR